MSHVEPTKDMGNTAQTEARQTRTTRLSTDEFKTLDVAERAGAMQDPDCPPDLIEAGCSDPDPCIRAVAVEHPGVPLPMAWAAFLRADQELTRLADAGEYLDVLHPRLIKGGYAQYWTDKKWAAFGRYRPCLGEPDRGGEPAWGEGQSALHLSTIETVGYLVGKRSWEQVAQLLDSPMRPCHLDSLMVFFRKDVAREGNARLRQVLARHPVVTDEFLLQLSADPCAEVRAEVAKQVMIRVKGATSPGPPWSPAWERRLGVPEVTAEILSRLSTDSAASVRAAVAGNHHLHHETLIRLCSDPDGQVRQAATRRLLEAL